MNEQMLIAELRNALQATTVIDKVNSDGVTTRITVLLVDDPAQRKLLTDRYTQLLAAVQPTKP